MTPVQLQGFRQHQIIVESKIQGNKQLQKVRAVKISMLNKYKQKKVKSYLKFHISIPNNDGKGVLLLL